MDPALDLSYLAAQTAGDTQLQRDLLRLFDAQCERLAAGLFDAPPDRARLDALHTLKGSAAAVGAHEIARLCARLEEAAAGPGGAWPATDVAGLGRAVQATRGAIARWCAGGSKADGPEAAA